MQRGRQSFCHTRLRGRGVRTKRKPFARLLPFGGQQMRGLIKFCARAQKMGHRALDREARTGRLHSARLP